MAKTITINVSDVDEKILYDILKKDESGVEGIQDWTDKAVAGRINHAWKEFKKHWVDVLMDDSSFTDAIPSNKTDFVNLIIARADYKDRDARDLLSDGNN
jgi:hypothetical protein|tara:strand:+ start:1536 stop:1835 length:300 start_codon:yes stop_codon:yes gene_type:complete